MKKLSLILLAFFLASAGSTSADVKGNSADLFVVSIDAPDALEKPNSSYEEEELYSVEAESHNNSGEQYMVIFYVEDPGHEATSVEITGPGITGSLSIDYDEVNKEWNSIHNDKLLNFGSSPPTPPLTYTFTIIDPSETTIKTDTVENFISEYPTNLSPSGGETITGPPFFSWTGIGSGYEYEIVVFDQDYLTNGLFMSYVWDSDDVGENTSARYGGPVLISGAKYYYWIKTGDEYGNNSHAEESSVYQPWPGSISGTVSYTGASTGTIYVVAFTNPTFSENSEDEITYVVLDSPGSYKIGWSGLPDGTYYVISAMATGSDADAIKITDPWGVYEAWENLTPVTITEGVVNPV